jgi:hypothetical protein
MRESETGGELFCGNSYPQRFVWCRKVYQLTDENLRKLKRVKPSKYFARTVRIPKKDRTSRAVVVIDSFMARRIARAVSNIATNLLE